MTTTLGVLAERFEERVRFEARFRAEPANRVQQAGGEHSAEVKQQPTLVEMVMAALHPSTVLDPSGPVTLLVSS
jgi:hypothetical protein